MKAVILAGGLGTRISEESHLKPKPMIEIGGMPLLLHVMKIYGAAGFGDFVVLLGYRGYVIKEYFANYALHRSDVTFDFASGEAAYFNRAAEPWRVTLVDTGPETMTGGRLLRARAAIGDGTFMMTYGDGVADIDPAALAAFHRRHGKAATVTAVQPPGRFGVLDLGADDGVRAFREKPADGLGWINGGFFVLEPAVFDRIEGDAPEWERAPLERLAAEGELVAYRHRGFWQPVDTLRDKRALEALWAQGKAPWKVWA